MRIEIEPWERAFVCGKTGSGKTFLAKRLLRSARRLVVLDSKGTLKPWGLEEWGSDARRRLRDGEEVRVRVAYEPGQDPDRFWSDVLTAVYEAGDVLLYIDEAFHVGAAGPDTRNMLLAVWTRGREFHVGAIAAAQRPVWLKPKFIVTECEHYFVFRLQAPEDRDYMTRMIGPELQEPIPPSDQYGFWYWDTRRQSPVYIPRLPARAPGAESFEDVSVVELQPEGV